MAYPARLQADGFARMGTGAIGPRGCRIVASLACLAYALVALGSGLDRAALHSPALIDAAPAPFASTALEMRAGAAIDAGDWRKAQRDGEAFLASAPIDPTAVGMVAAAREGLGDARGAEAAYRVAAKMGWREPLTQTYWMNRALAQGDYRGAALRADAMLRVQPGWVMDRSLLDPMERDPRGQQALAERMIARPDWLDTYMVDYGGVPVDILLLRAAVLDRAARLGVSAGCDGAASLAHRLVELGEAQAAARVWHGHCPQAGSGIVADGNFAAATIANTETPFDWQFSGTSDVDIGLARVPGGKKVIITTSAPFTRIVVSQFLVVPAGSYRLSWESQGHTTRDTPMVVASLDCGMQSGHWLPATLDPQSGRWFADVSLGDDCAGKWLNFAVRPGVEAGAGVRGGEVTLGAVRLSALAGGGAR